MTANSRILVNFLATYGRSVYSLILGLFCGRWMLEVLGESDFGLWGLIGGLTIFLTFFNSLLANSISRFFAYEVGKASASNAVQSDDCVRWFNVAFAIHTVIPVLCTIVGYPIGVWMIESFLSIPLERIASCIWVWRWVCVGTFLSMVFVPVNAMYQAKQLIAELTIYSVITSTVNVVALYYMLMNPGDWLTTVAFISCLLTIMPQLVIGYVAYRKFPECKLVPAYMFDVKRMRELFVYVSYRFFGAISVMLKKQGIDILVNKVLGPTKNAVIAIGGTVSGHCNGLSGALLGALSPAITSAYGAKDWGRVGSLSGSACRASAVMLLVFIVPLSLEIDQVLKLWLKAPPSGVSSLCVCLLYDTLLDNISCGLYMPIFASGNIKGYQLSCIITGLFSVPVAAFLLWLGLGVLSVGFSLLICSACVVLIRLYFAKRIWGCHIRVWVMGTLFPIALSTALSLGVGALFDMYISASPVRVVWTTILSEAVLLPLVWFWVLQSRERELFSERILKRFVRFGRT